LGLDSARDIELGLLIEIEIAQSYVLSGYKSIGAHIITIRRYSWETIHPNLEFSVVPRSAWTGDSLYAPWPILLSTLFTIAAIRSRSPFKLGGVTE